MKSIVLCLLSLFMSLLSIPVSAQVEADIIRPSVNANQFSLDVKAETALSKGQLSVNIPLMELKGKGYDLPISLTFYSGDVTSFTEASPVGLGWALMAGGVITKTIRGADDLNFNGSYTIHHCDSNYIVNGFNNWNYNSGYISDILYDPMPDEYTYSLPGHSGTIDVSIDGNTTRMTLFPDESYKMESTENGFCITADDGTKFYFEDAESRTVGLGNESTSWFLSRIETTKGGAFTFEYANEDYFDLSTGEYETDFEMFRTKRIASIVSDFDSVAFKAVIRSDRGDIGNQTITNGLQSKRINKIELRDKNGDFVKGYELDNSSLFELYSELYKYPNNEWCNYRHKLSSITQYDSAGNRLPPYVFTYSYRFSKSRLADLLSYTTPEGDYLPRDSWTSCIGSQAYVDLDLGGNPLCHYNPYVPNSAPEGFVDKAENYAITANDYFCLASILYPTGTLDEYTYEEHRYRKVNKTLIEPNATHADHIYGRRLAKKKRHGSEFDQETEYVYLLHDSYYNANGPSSGVLTNPSIHCATSYTLGLKGDSWFYSASRITSGKAFNTYMGPPVCYTEVEEVEMNENNDTLSRTIHYFEPQTVSPPVNYIIETTPHHLLKIENRIFGTKSGYSGYMLSFNNANYTYITYPVGEFYNVAYLVDQPLKEVFIGRDRDVRSIRKYLYYSGENYMDRKYGYKVISQQNAYHISRSEYITRRSRLLGINTTSYYYNGNVRDSICESYEVTYNKGRVCNTYYSRGNDSIDSKSSHYYFPGDILNIVGNNTSPVIEAMSGLVEKNIVSDPIKTIQKRKGIIIGGECKDYQMLSGKPLLKSLYRLKNTGNNSESAPSLSGNSIDYHADLYKEGEILTYDTYLNPEHVRLNDTRDRIYVWGYGGRFPIAVIDNMNYTTFQASAGLRSAILQLATYRKIETGEDCTSLRNLNATIRNLLPDSAHITTYTYDPHFGMTSEIDDSNLGAIYTYDTFGRLIAKYDENYKKLEEYNYHLKLQ